MGASNSATVKLVLRNYSSETTFSWQTTCHGRSRFHSTRGSLSKQDTLYLLLKCLILLKVWHAQSFLLPFWVYFSCFLWWTFPEVVFIQRTFSVCFPHKRSQVGLTKEGKETGMARKLVRMSEIKKKINNWTHYMHNIYILYMIFSVHNILVQLCEIKKG